MAVFCFRNKAPVAKSKSLRTLKLKGAAVWLEEFPLGAQVEHRSCPRFPVQVPVLIEFCGKVFETHAVNISRAGLLVTGAEVFPPGSSVTLRLTLTREIELKGVVRHTVHGCGIQFIGIPPDEQAKLNAYLDRVAMAVAEPFTSNL